jgi:hypothetical protein
MSFKFNPNAGDDKKYVSKAGVYEVSVTSVKMDYLPPRADLYIRVTFTTTDGELVNSDIFGKPDKNGGHERLDQFVASTAVDTEIKEYIDGGEFEVNEDFLQKVGSRAIGRNLKLVVTERKYTRKDGTEGVAYQGSFFRRLPNGPNPF